MQQHLPHKDYGTCERKVQLKIDESFAEKVIPADDSVRLLAKIAEGMDLSALMRAYDSHGRPPATPPPRKKLPRPWATCWRWSEKALQQIVPAPLVVVGAHITEQDNHIVHRWMYFIDERADAIDSSMNVACEINHNSSSFCTYYTDMILQSLGFPENVIGFGKNVILSARYNTAIFEKVQRKYREIIRPILHS